MKPDYHITLEETIESMDIFYYLANYCYITDGSLPPTLNKSPNLSENLA